MILSGKKIYIAGGVILAIIIVYAVWPEQKSYITAEVKRGKIVESVSATGVVNPAKDLDLRFQTTGRVEKVDVSVGQEVKKGQELARLQLGDLVGEHNEKKAALDVAKAQLAQIREGATSEEIQVAQTALDNAIANSIKEIARDEQNLKDIKVKAEIDLAEDYTTAKNNLNSAMQNIQEGLTESKKILDDTTVNSNFDQQAKVLAREKRLRANASYEDTRSFVSKANATSDYNDIDEALDRVYNSANLSSDAIEATYDVLLNTTVGGGLSQSALDAYKTTVSTARTNVNLSRTDISDSIQNINSQLATNTKSINTAQNALDTTKTYWETKIKSAERDIELTKAPARQSDIDLYEAKVRQAQAAVSKSANTISKSILNSPIDGIIGSVDLKIGELTDLSMRAVSVINNLKYEIEADIAETDIGKVNIFNKSFITYDAFPGKTPAEATVVQINPKGRSVEGVIYYKTTINLNVNDKNLKAGLTANIEIINSERENALFIPQRAVVETSGKKYVKVLNNGAAMETEITTGILGTEGEVEIISGLNEGDMIILAED